jgi:hypothetical protein
METAVAFAVVHVNVAEAPAVIVIGDAVSVAVGGTAGCTVTLATEVAVPPLPVAVNVYCVVADGVTAIDPEAATIPMPLLIETVLAFVVVHVKVAELPAVTVAGVAESDTTGASTELDIDVLLPQPDRSPIQTHTAIIDKYLFDKDTFCIPRNPIHER